MPGTNSIFFYLQIILLSMPLIFWKYTRSNAFTLATIFFIINFACYSFFRIMEKFFQYHLLGSKPAKWSWIVVQIVLLLLIVVYSKKLYDMLK